MDERLDNLDDLLDRFCDGVMTDEEREAFERRLASEPSLRAQVEIQSQIDGSLRRSVSPPEMDLAGAIARGAHERTEESGEAGVGARARAGPGTPASVGPLWKRPVAGLAAAAAILIVGLVGWKMATGWLRPKSELERLWAREVANDFDIIWECKSDAELLDATSKNFGQAMLARSEGDVRLVGWDYVPESMDASIGMLIAEGPEGRSIVLGDSKGLLEAQRVDARSGLSLFRRNVGEATLYELTPAERPRALELFYIPERTGNGDGAEGAGG